MMRLFDITLQDSPNGIRCSLNSGSLIMESIGDSVLLKTFGRFVDLKSEILVSKFASLVVIDRYGDGAFWVFFCKSGDIGNLTDSQYAA